MAAKKRRRKARKQSGDKVSSYAARIMRMCNEVIAFGGPFITLRVNEVSAIAASVLSQDETKGKRK